MTEHPYIRYFAYSHLPGHLRAVAEVYHAMACKLVEVLPHGLMLDDTLRTLLQSKDAAVRAALGDE